MGILSMFQNPMPDVAPEDYQSSNQSFLNSLPDLSGLKNISLQDYVPNISAIQNMSMPRVFGSAPAGYEGLLGADRTKALESSANLQGLLGLASSLAQGMSSQGPRRSALQNILGSLSGGFNASSGAYEKGLAQYGQQQQIGAQQRQLAGINELKMAYPELAAMLDSNPAGAMQIIRDIKKEERTPETVVVDNALVNKATGVPIYTGAKAAPMTKEQATAQGLDTSLGQVYQMDSKGKIDLVSGTRNEQPSDVQSFLYAQSQGYKGGFEDWKKGPGKVGSDVKVYTGDLSKGTAGKVEESALNTGDAINRLNSIQYSYRPEYQNIKFKAAQEWAGLKDKFGALPENEKAVLGTYSKYKQNAVQNLNLTIKDLTGAAMGEAEAKRIISTLPNAGSGVFDGDSPTEFQSKLNNALTQTKYSLARKNYALKNGFKWENIQLDKMPEIIQSRGKQIEQQYKLNPSDPATKQIVLRQLAAEFGISF